MKKIKIPIHSFRLMLMFFFVLSSSVKAQNNVVADFEITGQCTNLTTLLNESNGDGIIGYLWEVSDAIGNTMFQSTDVNPIFAFDEPGIYTFKLTVTTTDEEISTIKSETIYDMPVLEFSEWQDLVCSNTDSSFYSVYYQSGFEYNWDMSGIPARYILQVEGEDSHTLKIKWGELEDLEISKQFLLTCTITAPGSVGSCQNEISRALILLSASVPQSENLQIVAKPNDNSVLFLIIDNPELYLFQWGYVPNYGPDQRYDITENNYFYFTEGLQQGRKYFVEIFNRDFSYCSTKVFFDGHKSAINTEVVGSQKVKINKVFPNPSSEYLNVELVKNSKNNEAISISVINFLGVVVDEYRYQLVDEHTLISFSVKNYLNGNYFLKLDVNGDYSTIKSIIVTKPY